MDKDFFNNLKNDINKKIEENVPEFEKKKKETIDSLKKAKEQTVNTLKSSKEVLNNSINSAFSYTIKCPNCGATVGGNTKFCTSCGHNLKEQVKKPDEKKEEKKPEKEEEKKQEERPEEKLEEKPKSEQNQKIKKKKKKEIIKSAVTWGVIILIIGIFAIQSNAPKKDERGNNRRPDEEVVATENEVKDNKTNNNTNTSNNEVETTSKAENVVKSPTPTTTPTPTPTPTPEPAVYYSTNNANTVGNGNAGKYAYCSKVNYSVYWIIDFDEGYAYNFTEGNGEDYCDKAKINSGTLKDNLQITWLFDETASWKLHFKSANSPESIVVVDHYGQEIDGFKATNLNEALELRNKKTIMES